MADLERVKEELKRQYLEGGKDQVVRFVVSIQDELTDQEGAELMGWSMGLRRVRIGGKPGLQLIHVDEVEGGSPGVPEHEREGVFVHSLKCVHCGLHFMTFSWQENRHNVGKVRCPECGDRKKLVHWLATVSREEMEAGGTEIHDLFPYPGSDPQTDSWDD
jgi:DNA-directed RNA polymerase subunit RPC12/RpoP